MGDFQAEAFLSFSRSFDFAPYKTLLDVGGSGAVLSIAVAKTNPHIRCTTLDLAQV
jgi:cyclopropane fatty-acyl-phospholipid synthase-like methyltransferase